VSPEKTTSPVLIALAVCTAAITAGALLSARSPGSDDGTQTSSTYILGPARALLSKSLYTRADIYFHKGARYHREEAFHGFFQKWEEAIHPATHAHREGNETSEILPWLRLATQSDPRNIEIYLVAAYWLNGDCGRPDLALGAIGEAIEKNPERYELHLEAGRIHLSADQYKSAEVALRRALNLIIKPNQPDPEQAKIDLAFIYTAQSYLFEALENRAEAINSIEKRLLLNPGQPEVKARLAKLQSGLPDPEAAKARLYELFHKTHQCDRDDHDHEP